MAREPGYLSDFGEAAQEEWEALLHSYLQLQPSAQVLAQPDERTPEPCSVDWGAYPVRIPGCLQSLARADRLLDWTTTQGTIGRAYFQEEYLEWRVVRDGTGKIRSVEITTEFPEYWSILAAHHPVKTLRLVAQFAGLPSVPPEEVYGGVNPFKPGVTPEERRAGFEDAMLPRGGKAPWCPYNNGERAICFTTQEDNTLRALVELVTVAAVPLAARDPVTGQLRKLSGHEALATGALKAKACRNSDPTIVGALIGLAWDGRLLALDDPVGVAISSVQHDRLLQPDGAPVPSEWFDLQRGARPYRGEGLERSQRLVLQVPPGLGFTVGDLIDSQTDRRIEYGGQIADLVQLAVYLRISEAGAVPLLPRELPLPQVTPCEDQPLCRFVRQQWQVYEEMQRNLLQHTLTDTALPGRGDRP